MTKQADQWEKSKFPPQLSVLHIAEMEYYWRLCEGKGLAHLYMYLMNYACSEWSKAINSINQTHTVFVKSLRPKVP